MVLIALLMYLLIANLWLLIFRIIIEIKGQKGTKVHELILKAEKIVSVSIIAITVIGSFYFATYALIVEN